jgi:hypothetical protein
MAGRAPCRSSKKVGRLKNRPARKNNKGSGKHCNRESERLIEQLLIALK